MAGLGGRARCQSTSAQGPAFAKRGAIADLGRHTEALLVHRHQKRVRLVVDEWVVISVVQREDGDRFVRREHISVHVAFGKQMLSRPEQFLHRFIPIFYRLIIHFHYDVPDQRRTDTFVSKRKMNVGRVAAVELEDWPYHRAHLLALHVGGVTGHTDSE